MHPHPLASRPISEIAAEEDIENVVAIGSLRRSADDSEAFLTHLGTAHCAGFDGIDFATHYGDGDLCDVPVTQWHRTRHGGNQPAYRLVAPALPGASQHPLLGGHVQDPDAPGRHLWQTPIGPRLLPWLADHAVAGVPVLPGTAAVEMMLAAAARVYGTAHVAASDVHVQSPLILDPEPQVTTRLVRDGDSARVEIVTASGDGVTVHARGTVCPLLEHEHPVPLTRADLAPENWGDYDVAALHRTFRDKHNVFHGPAFTAIDRIQVHPTNDLALSVLRTHETAQVSAWPLSLHPALADQVVQTAVAAWLAHYTLTPGPVVVAGFDEVKVYGPTAHVRRALVRLHQADDLACTASARLATADGTVVAEIRGLRVANITPPTERFTARLTHQEWVPAPPAQERPRATEGVWTVLTTEDSPWPAELALELKKQAAGGRALPLDTILAGPAALTPCTGVVLALSDEQPDGAPQETARRTVARVVGLLRLLSQWDRPARLWVMSRSGRAPLTTAAVRGLLRSVAYEHPELRAGTLEFTPHQSPYADIVDELLDDQQPLAEIALLPTGRHVAQVLTGPDTCAGNGAEPVRPGAAYLVTGGLGGLGLLTVEWLAQRGAGRIVISTRSTPAPEAEARLQALRDAGTDIDVIPGDIGDPAAAKRAVAAAGGSGRVLRGVFHAAGVVEDSTVANLDDALLERVWRGKADGAWALHQASTDRELDHFVVYSSVASLMGSPGQAAYAAANAFLDGLVAHRLDGGLPATGIHWGAWSQVGRGQHLADQGFLTISPADGIDALERILTAGHHQLAYSPLDTAQWIAPYPALRTSTLLAPLLTGEETEQDEAAVREQLLAVDSMAERREILETFVIETVRELLGGTTRHIGPHTSMVILGLDSLGAVQLQQRLQRALRTELKPGVIWVKPSAAALAEELLSNAGLSMPLEDAS
ncbi:SDR family NAD(P)-dependent oxidoreductase [Streptomyces lavendulae]|uniref:SDR family NAD(P)-dependent oxidoreductase n=1 Tax=Streptomyces lavendulae TaxID=1914 RepID=UPI0031E54A18